MKTHRERSSLIFFLGLEARETTGFMQIYEVVTQSVSACVKIFSSQLLRQVRQVNVLEERTSPIHSLLDLVKP